MASLRDPEHPLNKRFKEELEEGNLFAIWVFSALLWGCGLLLHGPTVGPIVFAVLYSWVSSKHIRTKFDMNTIPGATLYAAMWLATVGIAILIIMLELH